MATSNVPNLQQLDTEGESDKEICQNLLEHMRFKIEYLKNRNKNQDVNNILCTLIVEEINNKFKHYIHVSDFHGILDDEL